MNHRFLIKNQSIHRKSSFLDSLDNLWIIFIILLITSFYWWSRISIGNLKVPLASFFVLFITLLWIYSLPFSESVYNDRFLIRKTMTPLLIMIWGMALSFITNVDYSSYFSIILEMIFYVFLFYLIVKTIKSESAIFRITIIMIMCTTYFALDGLYRFFITKSIWRLGAGDVHTATNMGAFMFQASIILVVSKIIFDKNQSKMNKLFFIFILTILAFAFIFTYSRGAWITLILGGIVLIYYHRKLIVMAFLLPLLVFLFLPEEIGSRFVSIFDTQRSSKVELLGNAVIKNTAHLRLTNWRNTINDMREHPIVGIGVGYYHGEDKGEFAPHSTYLRIWAEGGPIAICAFLWFLFNLANFFTSNAQENKRKSNWILIGYHTIIITHVFYLFLGDWAYQIYYWVFAGLSIASLKIFYPDFFKNVAKEKL